MINNKAKRAASAAPDQTSPALASALRTVSVERQGLLALEQALAGPLAAIFDTAIELIAAASGRVIVTGMGKSGHVGRKIAATLASTGTPAHFVHPGEASHGDLGMIRTDDVIIALSWSGETRELADIVGYASRFAVPLIAVTSNARSALGKAADACLCLPKATEACPNGLAPTTSTTMQLALGDAIAIALLEGRGFSARDFSIFHPGGKLGAQLRKVSEVMRKGEDVPVLVGTASIRNAIDIIGAKGLGCVLIQDDHGKLAGIVTDGDLRRSILKLDAEARISSLMTPHPRAVTPDTLAAEALDILNGEGGKSRRITALAVVDAQGRIAGLVHIHDLLRAGVA